MSLNVGGIYVRTKDHAGVVAVIQKLWRAVGAKPLEAAPPLSLEPLSVEKTGMLGYCVFPAKRVGKDSWIAVYDSERYTGSEEVAKLLAKELDTLVVLYAFSGTVDQAVMTTYSGATKQPSWHKASRDWGTVESAVSELPYAFVYFNQLRGAGKKQLAGAAIFGFQDLPYRKRGYRGPSEEEQTAASALATVGRAISDGDAAGVRAAYKRNVALRDEILSAVNDGMRRGADGDNKTQRVVLEMANEMLEDAEAYWRVTTVAEAALLAGKLPLFRRAAKVAGRHVNDLSALVAKLLAEKRFTEALEVSRAIVAHEGAALIAFNHLAYSLIGVNPLPADVAKLLATCEARGLAYSYIFHNTACVWLRLGDRERALEAVRSAIRANYPDIAKMRVDTDLAPLFDDPRFAAAFDAPTSLTLDELVVTQTYNGTSHVVQRPVLMFQFFLQPLGSKKVGPPIAALAEAYLADVPKDALVSTRRNGPWKALTKATLTKDLNKLRTATDESFFDIHYRGATDESGGAPTEYGMQLDVWGENDDLGDHTRVPSLSLWFPAELANGDVDAIAERFARYCRLVPIEAGGAGLRVLQRRSDYVETWWNHDLLRVNADRLPGNERHPWRDWTAGRAAGPMWLSFLSTKLAAKLGGSAALRKKLKGAVLTEVADRGMIIRASRRPALTEPHLGVLPSVARAFEPIFVVKKGDKEASAHYRRLFDLADTAYENGST